MTKHIAILGAGYTGLTAALRLLQKGYTVTIYEKSQHLGGLAADFNIEGAPLERAYHHLFRTDTDIISLMKELGIGESLQWRDSSIGLYYEGIMYPFMTPKNLLAFTPLSFFDRLRAGIVVLFLQLFPFGRIFESITAYSFMKFVAGNSVTKVIWEPLLKGKFHAFYDKVSMAWLWARLHVRANSKKRGDSGEKLGYPRGGFMTITNALVAKVKELGGRIIQGADVTGVDADASHSFITVNGKKETFDACIATIPSHVFHALTKESPYMTEEYTSKLTSIPYLGAVVMVFSSEQSLSKYYWHNVNDVTSPFLVFIQHTNLLQPSDYGNKQVYYIGTYVPHDHEYFSMSAEEIKTRWFSYLKQMFHDFDKNQIRETFLFSFKNAQHIVDTDYKNHIPEVKTPLPTVWLSNFSQIFPEDRGTNYAVREGNKIATAIDEAIRA